MNIKKDKIIMFSALAAGTAALVVSLTLLFSQKKIGYLDVQVLLNEYPPAKLVRSQIIEETKPWKKQLDDLLIDLRFYKNEFSRQSQKGNQVKMKEAEKNFKRTQGEYRQLKNRYELRVAQLEKERMGPIFATLNAYLSDFGEENNYYMIWSVTSSGNLAYVNEAQANVTSLMIEYIKDKTDIKTQKPEKPEDLPLPPSESSKSNS